MTIHITIPSLYCPIPVPNDHPELALLERRGLDWLAAHGVVSSPRTQRLLADTRSHVLMSLMAPWTSADSMQIAVDWCYLFFALDNLRTDTGPTSDATARLMRWFDGLSYAQVVVAAPPSGADPFYSAIVELSTRVRAMTCPALWRRWVDAHFP